MKGQSLWEKTLHELLGDKNPCKVCLVQASCDKSFTKHNSACEVLADKIEEALNKKRDEHNRKRNENKK